MTGHPLIKVKCDTCGTVYQITLPKAGFMAPCSLRKPPGRGTVKPV